MTSLRDLGPELRAALRRMLDDPADIEFLGEALRQGIISLSPAQIRKLMVWQTRTRPSAAAEGLRRQMNRLGDGRAFRRSVLPRTGSTRQVDFGGGLMLRFADGHPAAEPFMRRVLPAAGLHEPELVAYLRRTVRGGDLVIDIGAHVGYVACVAAALGATVIAAEMQPSLIPIIQLNAALNELWRIHPLCAAIGDRNGLVPAMRVSPTPGWQASMGQWERAAYPLSSVNHDCIPCLTLDALCADARPALVKVDVEGAEARVLAGARELIRAESTRFVVEVHAHLLGGFGNTLADLLAPFEAERWALSFLSSDGPAPLSRVDFLDPAGPIATHAHNAPVLFEPRRR